MLSEPVAPGRADAAVDVTDTVRVFGPASLSNLGPGFDAIGLCITGIGDVVEARVEDRPGVRVEAIEGDGGVLPTDPVRNTAAVAALTVLEALQAEHGLVLRIYKQMPNGSGIGSSAASAVAGAWAANAALGQPLAKEDLVQAVLAGEQIASGAQHGDNVLPALFGGLVLVSATNPSRYRRIPLPKALPIALVLPEVRVFTKQARDMLPPQVPLRDAAHNAGELAFLVDAFRCGDWATVGRCIMQDRLVEPVRATLVPCYEPVRGAAMDAGALGCALTGSGPAMFALAESDSEAERIVEAMVDACSQTGIAARGVVTAVDPDGVRVV